MIEMLEYAGVFNKIHLFGRSGKIGFFENTEDPKHHNFKMFDSIKECDDTLWKTYRISLVDFPYFKLQIQKLIKENDDWKDIYNKFKLRIN